MRLLNTSSLQLEELADSDLDVDGNQYAILSHRWGPDADEVSYEDMVSPTHHTKKKGFAKIKSFCDVASSQNIRYGWVDTCCINKRNSSELSEAINSMYMWYSHSKICVVYLEDVPHKQLAKSAWFDRGWTLQQLIAPKVLTFFDHDWQPLGTKLELVSELSRITRIPTGILTNAVHPSTCSVAQRMSWAAKRNTKRVEDRAYCLMGLFEVNMPMIYGERDNAFLRLQQHIVQKSKDESLFAWAMEAPSSATKPYSRIYAPSPSVFADCSDIVPAPGSSGFSENNGELSIRLPVAKSTRRADTSIALLRCYHTAHPGQRVYIVIAALENGSSFVRVRNPGNDSQGLIALKHVPLERNLCFPVDPKEPPDVTLFGFWLRTLEPPGHAESDVIIQSNRPAPSPDYIHQYAHHDGNTGIVHFKPKDSSTRPEWSRIRWIKFGFDKANEPVLWLANDTQSERLRDPFDLAATSGSSTSRLLAHKEIMQGDIEKDINPNIACGEDSLYFRCSDLWWKWPHGKALLLMNQKKGLENFTIDALDVMISVQKQRYCSPTTGRCGITDDGGLQPTRVWVVDITTTRGRPKAPFADPTMDWLFFGRWTACLTAHIVTAGYFLLCAATHLHGDTLCVERTPCFLLCYPCYAKKWTKQKEEKNRERYEKNASRRVPILLPSGVNDFKLETLGLENFWPD